MHRQYKGVGMVDLIPYNPPSIVRVVVGEPISQNDYTYIKQELATHRQGRTYVLIVKTLRNTGLRLNEVMTLTRDQIERNGPDTFLVVQRGKKRGMARYERVAVSPEIGMDLISSASLVRPGECIWPIKKRIIQQQFHDAALRSLGRPAHIQQLRHLFVSTLIDGGVPVGAVSKLVGHADERTTLGWYYDLTADKRAEIARRMPI